jgi:hypothetical protein
MENVSLARLRLQQEQKQALDSRAESRRTEAGEVLLSLDHDEQRVLNEAWVRLVVLGDLRPMRFCESPGFRKFMALLSSALGTTRMWDPPSHGTQHGIVEAEFQRLRSDAKSTLAKGSRSRCTLHFDAWTDKWDRVWVLGVVWWLDVEDTARWKYSRVGFAFEEAARWSSDDAGSQHCSAVAAQSLRAAWRLWGLGDLPLWACSDSARTAVATSDKLSLISKRCTIHFLQIPVQRLLFASKPRGGRVLLEAPEGHLAPTYLLAFEKARGLALALHNNDLAKEFQSCSSRMGVVRRTLQEAVLDSGRVYASGAAIQDNYLAWWPTVGRKHYALLYHGAVSLLSHRCGNATEERVFSKAGYVLGEKRSKAVDVQAKILLNFSLSNDQQDLSLSDEGDALLYKACPETSAA